MKKSRFKQTEQLFLLAAAAVCAVSVALAFWFAVPLRPQQAQSAFQSVPLIQLARVDLNTADQAALCTLPGVGEKRAQALLEYRGSHGPFRSAEQAAEVPGLTAEIVAQWADLAYVSEPPGKGEKQ